jgi:pimeloyl-ACP methyl ester carboxylesterase
MQRMPLGAEGREQARLSTDPIMPSPRVLLSVALVLAARATASSAQAAFADTAHHRVVRVTVAPGVALEVLDWGGTGPALVFLAGMVNTGHVFDTFAPRFTDRFHVVTLTRRGLGASDRPDPGPYDAATLAADVKAVLDSLGIARAMLAGHSYGGSEMSWFAALYPERVEKIVYLDSSCSGCTSGPSGPVRRPYRPVAPPVSARDTLTPRGMAAYQRRTLGFSYPEAELRSITRYGSDGTVSDPVPAFVWRALANPGHPGFARIRAPALGIFAERSTVAQEFWWARRMGPPEHTLAQVYVDAVVADRRAAREEWARAMPDARVEVIPGAHHFIFLSHPDRTERLMRAFLLPPADSAR